MIETLIPNAGEYPITRHLPKTGQTISYGPDDDGDDVMSNGDIGERGWWRRRLNANNKTRFVIKTLSSVDVVVDRATGLMWPRDCTGLGGNNGNPIGNWLTAINWAEALNFAGFTDWHLPNCNEILSIMNYGQSPAWYNTVWQNVINNYYWTSTTNPTTTTSAFVLRFQFWSMNYFSKTSPPTIYVIAVRETA